MSKAALRRRWLPAAVIATAAAALIAMAVPRVVAGILLIPGDPILRRVLERKPVSATELERLAESRRAALNWHARGRTGTDLGLALLLRAERMRIVVAERDLVPARAALAAALARRISRSGAAAARVGVAGGPGGDGAGRPACGRARRVAHDAGRDPSGGHARAGTRAREAAARSLTVRRQSS